MFRPVTIEVPKRRRCGCWGYCSDADETGKQGAITVEVEENGKLLCRVDMAEEVLPDTSDLSELARVAHGYGDALDAFEESGL